MQRVTVTLIPSSLYYDVSLWEHHDSVDIKDDGGQWKRIKSVMCHENQLENTIADLLRGPSINTKRE